MDAWADRYAAIIDSIYMDYYTNAYIMADYSNMGFESMYPYIDKAMLKLILLSPETTKSNFTVLMKHFRKTEIISEK